MRDIAALLVGSIFTCVTAITCQADEIPLRMIPMQAVTAPPGYVDFCTRNPRDCGSSSVRQEVLSMNANKWQQVGTINSRINQTVTSSNDLELFGEAEHWTIAETAGDCEDFVLLKKQRLEQMGYPSSTLLITVVLDENNEGHAVLTITTDTGDYVLDNRRDEILPFASTGYQFLKRQSQLDPKRWVSLASVLTDGSAAVASRSP